MESERNQTPDMSGIGYLTVHVTTARGAIPLGGARVTVRNGSPDGEENRGDVIASLISDPNGNTVPLPIPTPPRAESLTPGGPLPYTPIHLEVDLEGYYRETYIGIPVFDRVTAIQPADLIPLPENGRTDLLTPDGERTYETTGPEL